MFIMHTALSTALVALASAAPIKRDNTTTFSVTLNINTANQIDSNGVPSYVNQTVAINTLTNLNDISCSEIFIDANSGINVNASDVKCRAYRDAAGQEPGSAEFSVQQPADLTTNLVEIGSVLCYVAEALTATDGT